VKKKSFFETSLHDKLIPIILMCSRLYFHVFRVAHRRHLPFTHKRDHELREVATRLTEKDWEFKANLRPTQFFSSLRRVRLAPKNGKQTFYSCLPSGHGGNSTDFVGCA
jgi:hypothetical protein